jgi:hypothetical protein
VYPPRPVRPVRRPRALWYLLSVLALLVALPLGLIGIVGLTWQTWQHPDSPTDRATLRASTSYELDGVQGRYGDIWTRLAPGDRVACTFTPTTGGDRFSRTFVVPAQHRPRHLSHPAAVQDSDTEDLGSFTAPTADTYQIRCTNRTGGQFDVRARQDPSEWVPITLYIAIGLTLAALAWFLILVRLRARSRLLRNVIDAGAELVTG